MRRSLTAFALMLLLFLSSCARKNDNSLLVYCGGTMRPPIEELAADFQLETGILVHTDYGDSGDLLIKIRQTRRGDLFVCHDPFATMAENDHLLSSVVPVARLVPVIAVPKGNPKNIAGLADLANPGLRLALPDPEYSSAGHLLSAILTKAGLTDKIKANTVVTQRSSGELVTAVLLGHADAAVCWDAVARQHPTQLDVVPIDSRFFVDAVTSATGKTYNTSLVRITVSSLSFSTHPQPVAKFLELVASDRGRQAFTKYGFTLIDKEP